MPSPVSGGFFCVQDAFCLRIEVMKNMKQTVFPRRHADRPAELADKVDVVPPAALVGNVFHAGEVCKSRNFTLAIWHFSRYA